MTLSVSKAVILGNGPSLRDLDFSLLAGFDTLGMNAAYRFWDTIDWRPTHYACLDDALIDTHHSEIWRLMEEGRVKTAFLSGRFLDYHPAARFDERYAFLDQFVGHWHRVRGKRWRLAFRKDVCFATSSPNMLTTGSYSVRYAAHLGYECLTLLGFDLIYEDLPRATVVSGHRLRLEATPEHNPNYFFDDYQRAGDEYHIPNPTEHSAELHIEAFRVLSRDFRKNGVPAKICCGNAGSRLVNEGIFPFCEFP